MEKPIVDSKVVIQAKTEYEQTLAGYIIEQHGYINFLESEVKRLSPQVVSGAFKTLTFRSKL